MSEPPKTFSKRPASYSVKEEELRQLMVRDLDAHDAERETQEKGGGPKLDNLKKIKYGNQDEETPESLRPSAPTAQDPPIANRTRANPGAIYWPGQRPRYGRA